MLKLYRKNPENFALAWIGIYCLIQSLANGLSARIGIPRSANAVLAAIQSIYLLWWLHKNHLLGDFRLNKPTQPGKNMLYYLPLLAISTVNLWLGAKMNLTPAALVFHILLMLCVGFLEELIFRGFLFEALRKKGLKIAIVVSSLTFGIGHIVNLFNGSGMSIGAVLFQMVYAVLFGFLVVTVYLRSGSLIPCIVSHQMVNISSAFANHQVLDQGNTKIWIQLPAIALMLLYLLVLCKTAPIQNPEAQKKNS